MFNVKLITTCCALIFSGNLIAEEILNCGIEKKFDDMKSVNFDFNSIVAGEELSIRDIQYKLDVVIGCNKDLPSPKLAFIEAEKAVEGLICTQILYSKIDYVQAFSSNDVLDNPSYHISGHDVVVITVMPMAIRRIHPIADRGFVISGGLDGLTIETNSTTTLADRKFEITYAFGFKSDRGNFEETIRGTEYIRESSPFFADKFYYEGGVRRDQLFDFDLDVFPNASFSSMEAFDAYSALAHKLISDDNCLKVEL